MLVGARVARGLIENEDMEFPLLTGASAVEEAVLI